MDSTKPFSEENLKALADLSKPVFGNVCYLVSDTWPIWGWSPKRKYMFGRWWWWGFGRPKLLVATDPTLLVGAIKLMDGWVDSDANPK